MFYTASSFSTPITHFVYVLFCIPGAGGGGDGVPGARPRTGDALIYLIV
jgi:hypothetical protein